MQIDYVLSTEEHGPGEPAESGCDPAYVADSAPNCRETIRFYGEQVIPALQEAAS